MTNFDNMEQNFVALTEEELTDVNGGVGYRCSCRRCLTNWWYCLGLFYVIIRREKMNLNKWTELTEEELMNTEGGLITIAMIAGGVAIFLGGRLIGQDLKRKFG